MTLLLLSLACRPSFVTVDDACHPAVKGAENGTMLANDFQQRVDCHRRLAGLNRVKLEPAVSSAAEAHATYMAGLGLATPYEESGEGGFTGQTVFDRLDYAGFEDPGSNQLGVWEIYGYRGALAVDELVDQALIAGLFLREPVMVSSSWAAGYGDADGWLEYVLVFDFPADSHLNRPVVYPVDGQLEVPTSFYAVEPEAPSGSEWLQWGELRGYPITLTFGSTQASGAWNSATNVYDVQVTQLELEGPEGLVPVDWVSPGDGRSWLNFTVGVVPKEPLEPSATYSLHASGTRGDDSWSVDSSFSTRLDDTPANQDLLQEVGFDLEPVSSAPIQALSLGDPRQGARPGLR